MLIQFGELQTSFVDRRGALAGCRQASLEFWNSRQDLVQTSFGAAVAFAVRADRDLVLASVSCDLAKLAVHGVQIASQPPDSFAVEQRLDAGINLPSGREWRFLRDRE